MSMRFLRLALALCPFVWTSLAFADPPPVIFPTAPIVNQVAAPQVAQPQQPMAQAPVMQAPAQVRAPAQPMAQAPQAPAQPYVAQPQQPMQVAAPMAPQAPMTMQPAAAMQGNPQGMVAPQGAVGEPQRPWLAPPTPAAPVAGADPGPSPWRVFSVLFFIALIGGMIVGLFGNISGTSLSPLALAFLVGYAADVFFSFLEGLLQNFRKPKAA